MFSSPQGIALKLPRSVKAAALAASLVFSALLTAVALRTPEYEWLAWISFLPLFLAVLLGTYPNTPEPRAEWNPDLSGACAVLQNQDYSHSLSSRFSVQQGLLTDSQGESPHLHWLACLLGDVCTAFLVPCANASLIGILSGARLSFPPCRSLTGSPNAGAWLPSQVVLAIQSWTFRQAQARAPPIQVAVPSRNLVGSAHRSKLPLRGRRCVRDAPCKTGKRVPHFRLEVHAAI